jgi:hypothetical protein
MRIVFSSTGECMDFIQNFAPEHTIESLNLETIAVILAEDLAQPDGTLQFEFQPTEESQTNYVLIGSHIIAALLLDAVQASTRRLITKPG